MRKYLSGFLVLTSMLILVASANSQETVYPAGANITVRYSLNRTSMSTADTLVVTRTFVNKTTYPVTGLYFSDNFSSQYRVVTQTVTVNGSTLAVTSTGPDYGQVTTGFNNYRWIIDSPVAGENRHRTIAAGDSVSLVVKIVCSTVGTYALPLHATVGYGNGSGIFAQANGATITVTSASDTTPPAAILDLGDIESYKALCPVRRDPMVWKVRVNNLVTIG